MAKVKFPFRIKSGGEYYESGEIVPLFDADEAIAMGGKVVSDLDDDRPFKCPHCEASYKEQGYLDSHINKKHSDM